jgi:molybdenum cofactor synthesis domain-containing protein
VRPLVEAQRDVLDAMRPLPAVRVSLGGARGLVLAEAVVAPHRVPPFDNSAVDGFAVRSADVAAAPLALTVIEDVPAGLVPTRSVGAGQATRIMTGAVIPAGADAVVMVEDTDSTGDTVTIKASVGAGDHVRRAGGDLEEGAMVFDAGERLSPRHIGVLASIGVTRPLVSKRPVVAVLSTGDELAPPDTVELQPGGIRDSNRPMLLGLIEELGAEGLDLGIVADDEGALRQAFDEASRSADAVVTSGGVSMGEHDLVKKVLADLGTVDFWRVAMQPAKPFAFGFLGDTPLFGLPGNPVSAVVAYEQFVRPALLGRMGATRLFRPRSPGVAGEAIHTDPEKTVFVRVVTEPGPGAPIVRPAGGQGSNVLSALAAADAFVVVPVGVGRVEAGERVEIEWFGSLERRTRKEALDG